MEKIAEAKLDTKYIDYVCVVSKTIYSDGNTCIYIEDEQGVQVGKATVNIPHLPKGEDEVFIRDSEENEGMLRAMQDLGIVGKVLDVVPCGYGKAYLVKLLV